MKKIRLNVYETNSSSTHSVNVATESQWVDWIIGKLVYHDIKQVFVSKEDAMAELTSKYDNPEDIKLLFCSTDEALKSLGYYTLEKYYDMVNERGLDFFSQSFSVSEENNITTFGYYGYEY